MRKKIWIKCVGLALAASLVIVGCDSGSNDNNVPVNGGNTSAVGTGGGTSGTGAGTTSAGLTGSNTGTVGGTVGGLTGGSNTGNTGNTGGNTGGTTNTTGTTGGTGTTGTGSGTTGTATTGGTTGNFNTPVTRITGLTSLNNPTQMVQLGNRFYFVDGFNLGQSNGRLLTMTATSTSDASTFSTPVPVTSAAGSPVTGSLSNPFGITTDGTNLYITVGFGLPQDGAVLRVSNITNNATTSTATFERITNDNAAGFLINPSFILTENIDNARYIYWSETSATGTGGRVRRVRADGTGTIDLVYNQLNFPAGIASDGTNLVICDGDGGAGGQVLIGPLALGTTPPYTPQSAGVSIVTPATGQQAISRPFDVSATQNGYFFTEGNALETSGLGPTGTGNGAVRFVPRGSTTATIIANGLTNAAGISAVGIGTTTVGVAFTESIATNGRVLSRLVNTTSVTSAAPTVIDTGLNRPIDVAIPNPAVPIFLAIINYNGGQANGLINAYGPNR